MIKNFPMALIWNLFAAGPFTRLIFRCIFKNKGNDTDKELAEESAEKEQKNTYSTL